MKVTNEKILMSEVAILYYEKKHTQQEIAEMLGLSRQTVSKLLNDAVKENIVEIKIHNPQKDCEELEKTICKNFAITQCVVCGAGSKNESVRRMMTVRTAVEYLVPILKNGNQKIALSWGRTIQDTIQSLPEINTNGNVVFPLFGATDNENSYFSSNELARGLADKIGANVKYAWFPYVTDNAEDCVLQKKLSYYEKIKNLWDSADIALVGIGNAEIIEVLGETFGNNEKHAQVIGDIATHFFDENGTFIDLYENTLCASVENIKNAKQTIAVACGNKKVEAICGALQTGLIDTLITDEYTAAQILEYSHQR